MLPLQTPSATAHLVPSSYSGYSGVGTPTFRACVHIWHEDVACSTRPHACPKKTRRNSRSGRLSPKLRDLLVLVAGLKHGLHGARDACPIFLLRSHLVRKIERNQVHAGGDLSPRAEAQLDLEVPV